MRAVLRVARTEVLEHRRQPAMLAIMVMTYLVFIMVFGAAFIALEIVASDPAAMSLVLTQLDNMGVELDPFIYLGVSAFVALMFTNMPLFVALFGAYSVLHDRTNGTMPYLMLSPLTRFQLLLGKLAGVMAIPMLLHFAIVGVSTLALGRLDILAPSAPMMGGSVAWWIAYLLSIPMAAFFIGAFGTVISALSRDVRTSLQYTQFFNGFFSIATSAIVVDMLTEGAVMQFLFSGAAVAGGFAALFFGARLISRDVPPT